jgi:hypothetical protein
VRGCAAAAMHDAVPTGGRAGAGAEKCILSSGKSHFLPDRAPPARSADAPRRRPEE